MEEHMTPFISSLRHSNGPASKQAVSYLMWLCSEPYIHSMQAGLIMESMQRSTASSLLQARIRHCQLRWQAGLQQYAQVVPSASSRLMMRVDLEG